MFSHIMVGANDIEASKVFYDAILGVLGAKPGLLSENLTGQKRYMYFLDGTTAFLTTVIAYFWLSEAISSKQIIGLCFGFLGVVILVNPANGSSTIIASICALIGSLCYAFNGNYLQKFHSHSNKKVLIGWSMFFGGLFMVPIAFFNLPDSMPNQNSFLALLWLSVVSTGIGYLGYVRLIG